MCEYEDVRMGKEPGSFKILQIKDVYQ